MDLKIQEHSLLSAIGGTPLVRLGKLFGGPKDLRVYAKMEMLNPGGSAKDRPALRMIREAWNAGNIGPGSVIVESSSGNLGISLAYICSHLGLRFICVIDPKTTAQNICLLKAYGAEIEFVSEPERETGEFLPARLERVRRLITEIPDSFWPNQYSNPNNYMAHYHTTMKEIVEELGRVDYVIGGVSTCGTVRGCAEFARDHGLSTQIVAVDAAGSVIFGGVKGKRVFPGLGAGIATPFSRTDKIDRVIHVAERDMVEGCRLLMRKESIMAGPSSGAVVMALKSIEDELPPGSVCAVILHDRGERYLDTVYSDEWVERQFGGGIQSREG